MYEGTPLARIEDHVLIGKEVPVDKEYVNVGSLILEKLKTMPKFLAQIDARTGQSTSFEEILRRSVKCALWMKNQGIRPGDIVGICVDNNLDVSIPVLGTLYLAAVVSGWDHEMPTRSARYFLSLISPKLIFVTAGTAKTIQQAAIEEKKDIKIVTVGKIDGFESLEDILNSVGDSDIDSFVCTPIQSSADVALISWSSGTTGLPKGTELSHRSLENTITRTEPNNSEIYVAMWMATIRWQLGLTLLLESILHGTRVVMMPDFDDDIAFFEFIDKYGVTSFICDPCVPIRWIKEKYYEQYQLRSLKEIVACGATLRAEKHIFIARAYPHVNILQCYVLSAPNGHGMIGPGSEDQNLQRTTDCGGIMTATTKDSKPGSSGHLCKGYRMKIADLKTGAALPAKQTGEIYVKSPFIMNGYYRNPEATKKTINEDGWLMTKDLGYYDEDGEIFITGRISDFINYRSINICPAEIETVLELHPSIMQAVVVAVPDEIDEEHAMAFVTKVPNKQVTVEELMKLVEDSLPWYCKLQAGIKFLEKMPCTATGKIARGELRKIAKESSSSSSSTSFCNIKHLNMSTFTP